MSGYFGPGSLTWRLTAERALLLGGPRALLMQLAHPLVATGVADHSSFPDDPMTRLRRTLQATLGIVFGDRQEADAWARRINTTHGAVRGELDDAVGRFPAGAAYRATDPDLLVWVHATLVDTTFEVYTRYVAPLSPSELDAAYEESKTAARLLLVPDTHLPATLAEFRSYVADTIASDSIEVGPSQRILGRHVLYPSVRYLPKPLFGLVAPVTIGLLPEKLRAGYGLRLAGPARTVFEASPKIVRRVLPLLPDSIRLMPEARRAMRREAAASASH